LTEVGQGGYGLRLGVYWRQVNALKVSSKKITHQNRFFIKPLSHTKNWVKLA